MPLELTPGELRMAEHARADAEAVARLFSPPVSAQNLHDAEKLAKAVLASAQYLKGRVIAAETPSGPRERPGRD